MKYVNYAILLVVIAFAAGWIFNYVDPYLGLGIVGISLYVVVFKISKKFKGETDAK